MAIHIPLDSSGNPDSLHLVLATRSGRFLYALPATRIRFTGSLTNGSELSFVIDKSLCADEQMWDSIYEFRLVYCPEINQWYQIKVSIDETVSTIKNVSAVSLGEAELSKIRVYDVEINTEADIERDDYVPTVLYNESNPDASLIDRLLYKAPHYRIAHVDDTLKNLQRTFTFSDKSVQDCFHEIGEELDCLFILSATKTDDKRIDRMISVYDMECYCYDCGTRGEFYGVCDNCGSTNISNGYGKDTTIYVSLENLADEIQYSTNDDEVMNCFRLKAGDDLMTATVINSNPNGSQYIWYISDTMMDDMSEELRNKISAYNDEYQYYQNEYDYTPPQSLVQKYNAIISKYSSYRDDLTPIPQEVIGYPAMMTIYYDTIDLQKYLDNVLMPSVEISSTTAALECAKLTASNLSPVAVADLASCSATTASSAVLGMAKSLVDSRYQIKVNQSSYNKTTHVWTGNFDVENYSSEEDASTSTLIDIEIGEDVETYTRQKIDKLLAKKSEDITDISSLFKLDIDQFTSELRKYCRQRLVAFKDACQAAIDILIQQGIADNITWASEEDNPYDKLYEPYLAKMSAIETELKIRDDEIAVLTCEYDGDTIVADGMQSTLEIKKGEVQSILDFEEYLGEDLWTEFATYRRDDTYSNQNFISDGLDNAELFKSAQEFLEKANKEIFKSATLQHTITANMHNLLIMPEFAPLVDSFELGNWIRIRSDGRVFRLRLAKYDVDYDSWKLNVEFTDVREGYNSASEIKNVLSSAKSMSSSYGAVARQASAGQKSKVVMDGWMSDGFSLTTNIVGGANNQEFVWNDSGFLGREYIAETGEYSLNQIKILSTGLYVTDDGWVTAKAGIGKYNYFDPRTQSLETGFGVIANQLIGNVMLTSEVGIFNDSGSVQITEDGFVMNARASGNTAIFTINREDNEGNKSPIMYLNSDGKLILTGDAVVTSLDADVINSGLLNTDRLDANSINIDKLTGTVTLDDWEIDLENETITLGSLDCTKLTGTLPMERIGYGNITEAYLETDAQNALDYAREANDMLSGNTQVQNINIRNAYVQSLTCSNITPTSFTLDDKSMVAKETIVKDANGANITIKYFGYD